MGKITITVSEKAHVNSNKKRKQKPDEWKCNVGKVRRNSGETYVSKRGRGAIVDAKECPPGGKRCAGRCHFNGCDLNLEEKRHVFHSFWNSGDFEIQRTYLRGLIEGIRRGNMMSYRYFLLINGERREVCKFTFMDVHQITRSMITTVQDKLKQGESIIQDGRGKHEHHHRISEEEEDMVRNHILSYNFLPVHYSRKNGLDQCLPPHLNVKFMFRAFKEANMNVPNIDKKEWLYRKVFTETGILPYKPKSDTCRTCDRYQIRTLTADTDQLRAEVQNSIMEHLIKGDSGYKSMYQDIEESRNDPDLIVICTDLQKVLFTPTLSHSDMFYSRQLSTYNLCIYDGKRDIGNMWLWNETEGKRGANEMASCIYHYIRQSFQVLEAGRDRRLILWSDRCRGQFNNYIILSLLMVLIKDGYFTEVEQKFLLSGHSFMPCDRLFGLIERRKLTCQALVPDHWERIIWEAQPSKPFIIRKLATGEILDFKSLEALCPRPTTLKVTEVARVLLSKNSPFSLLSRESHCNEVWALHTLYAPRAPRVRDRIALSFLGVDFNLEQCYLGPIPLSAEKKKDFRAFLEFLEPHHREFYERILNI